MIAKKPKSSPKPPSSKETKAQKFIRAGQPAAAPANANGTREIKPVLIGFDVALLARIDAAAGQMGLSRTAFVVMSCAERAGRVERGE